MHGRVDDVINISGHRLSTAEIEQTVITHSKVSDAASISIPDEIKGEAIVIFVILENKPLNQGIENEIKQYVVEKIGKIALPKNVFIISDLPKTRTGKIMRRLLRAKLLGNKLGDLSSLENPQVLEEVPNLS
jgi:acetyl-CoA synthetase